jgi:hypothetical protein
MNPIEQVFAKLKHLLRKAAARTIDAVCAAIGHALDAFTPEECANFTPTLREAENSPLGGRHGLPVRVLAPHR